MSRIGKQAVVVPQGVKAALQGQRVLIEGPKGKLEYQPKSGVKVVLEGGKLLISRTLDDKQSQANWGTTRAHLNNMVQGVSKGWKKTLELVGVGYNAKIEGTDLVLAVGLSHDVVFPLPKVIKCTITKTTIELESCDKELLGTFAANVRKSQPPEPYLGKGIKYAEEVVRRKAGKAAKK
jgi:large subunit ribosomal protein L6